MVVCSDIFGLIYSFISLFKCLLLQPSHWCPRSGVNFGFGRSEATCREEGLRVVGLKPFFDIILFSKCVLSSR